MIVAAFVLTMALTAVLGVLALYLPIAELRATAVPGALLFLCLYERHRHVLPAALALGYFLDLSMGAPVGLFAFSAAASSLAVRRLGEVVAPAGPAFVLLATAALTVTLEIVGRFTLWLLQGGGAWAGLSFPVLCGEAGANAAVGLLVVPVLAAVARALRRPGAAA